MTLLRITGFDPSLRHWGIAKALYDTETGEVKPIDIELIETADLVDKKARQCESDLNSAKSLQRAMRRVAAAADIVITEIPTGSKSARASMGAGICIGVLASCMPEAITVTPIDVKKASTGTQPRAKKGEKSNRSQKDKKGPIIAWAYGLYPELPWSRVKRYGKMELTGENEHMADAIAIIHAGVLTEAFKAEVARLSTQTR